MSTFNRLNRRQFLGISGAALLGGAGAFQYLRRGPRAIPGEMIGANSALGHRLRGSGLPEPTETRDQETLIVGGGVAGLSAAWWLSRSGYRNYRLLELENEVGGNSRSGKNSVSAYPWGAHYVPLPTEDARYVRLLFEELGVIGGYSAAGLPIYNEYYLCADPHERLYHKGQWHENLVPQNNLSQEERRQYDSFFALMERYRKARGNDGRRAFSIPVEESSTDPEFRLLDRLSMAEFLKQNGCTAAGLLWYVNYCCRDDYGAGIEKVSAWAGVHYFASRAGIAANADPGAVLTWPEGNGWLVNRLREKAGERISSGQLVFSIQHEGGRVLVDVFDSALGRSIRYVSAQVIVATPRFIAGRVVKKLAAKPPAYLAALRYSPWMVANVTLSKLPPQGKGAPLSWDNVSYYSDSIGYVVATHQALSLSPAKTVLTLYQPLDKADPKTARLAAQGEPHAAWAEHVAGELEKMHPGIRPSIENIDVVIWGHGMITPQPGFLWGPERKEMLRSLPQLHFAHSDMSGVSIFEEAQYRGVRAAEAALHELGHARRLG